MVKTLFSWDSTNTSSDYHNKIEACIFSFTLSDEEITSKKCRCYGSLYRDFLQILRKYLWFISTNWIQIALHNLEKWSGVERQLAAIIINIREIY
jgi:hypothetical protein